MTRLRKINLTGLLIVATAIAGGCRRAEGPVQPIAYSHKLHAGDLKIACLYCHFNAARSTAAGVPPLETCYGCHKLVKLKSPEIMKVMKAFEAKIPFGRMGVPDDIGKVAVFLASSASDYMTGQTVVVDGGMLLS